MTVTGDCLEVFRFLVMQSPFGFAHVKILAVPTTSFIYSFGHLRPVEPVFVEEIGNNFALMSRVGNKTNQGTQQPLYPQKKSFEYYLI